MDIPPWHINLEPMPPDDFSLPVFSSKHGCPLEEAVMKLISTITKGTADEKWEDKLKWT